jgi:hypothetical protein
MEVSGQLHAPAALNPGENPRYPLDRRLGEPHSRSESCEEEKNLAMLGIEHGLPARSPSLYRLSYPHALLVSQKTLIRTSISKDKAAAGYKWLSVSSEETHVFSRDTEEHFCYQRERIYS